MAYPDHVCDDCGVSCPNKSPDDNGWECLSISSLGKNKSCRNFVYLCPKCAEKIFIKFPKIRWEDTNEKN